MANIEKYKMLRNILVWMHKPKSENVMCYPNNSHWLYFTAKKKDPLVFSQHHIVIVLFQVRI